MAKSAERLRIQVRIGPREAFSPNEHRKLEKLDPLHVDFYASEKEKKRRRLKHNGTETYVISHPDKKSKRSNQYRDCTGLAIVGRGRKTGENISILTHQWPHHVFQYDENCERFKEHLNRCLEKFSRLALKEQRDAVLFGGRVLRGDESRHRYNDMRSMLEGRVEEKLGVELRTIHPTIGEITELEAWLNTARRRLFILTK